MNDLDAAHPSAEELRAFSLGLGGEDDLTRIAAHLDDCPTCRARVDGLCAQDPLRSGLQAADWPGGGFCEDADQRREAARVLQQERRRPPSSANLLARARVAPGDETAIVQEPAAAAGVGGSAEHPVRRASGRPAVQLPRSAADSSKGGGRSLCPMDHRSHDRNRLPEQGPTA